MKTRQDLFSARSWFGEFYAPDDPTRRLVGRIDYSPDSGVILTASLTHRDFRDETDTLHGVLEDGSRCSLFGRFQPFLLGSRWSPEITTWGGKWGFDALIAGDWLLAKDEITNLNFSLSNLQEFFYPRGYRDSVRYSASALYSIPTDYGGLEVWHSARFTPFDEHSSVIYSEDDTANEAFHAAIKKVFENFPQAHFGLRTDLRYVMRLVFKHGETLNRALSHVMEVANALAVLTCAPVYPDTIQLTRSNAEGRITFSEVYPALVLDRRTIDLCLRRVSHFHMPITASNVDVPTVLRTWLAQPVKQSIMVASIQHETGFSDEHDLHGALVLYATHLESIGYRDDAPKASRYGAAVQAYASARVASRLADLFAGAGEPDLGKGIGDLRNEIAHIGRPRRLLAAFSLDQLARVSRLLQITVLGYILVELGLPRELIERYEDEFTSAA